MTSIAEPRKKAEPEHEHKNYLAYIYNKLLAHSHTEYYRKTIAQFMGWWAVQPGNGKWKMAGGVIVFPRLRKSHGRSLAGSPAYKLLNDCHMSKLAKLND